MKKYLVKMSGVVYSDTPYFDIAKEWALSLKQTYPRRTIEIFEEKLVAEFKDVSILTEIR